MPVAAARPAATATIRTRIPAPVRPRFKIGTSGPKLKNSAGVLEVRNAGDTDFETLRVKALVVDGTTTAIDKDTVSTGDNEIELNADITTAAANSDGGIRLKRLARG